MIWKETPAGHGGKDAQVSWVMPKLVSVSGWINNEPPQDIIIHYMNKQCPN